MIRKIDDFNYDFPCSHCGKAILVNIASHGIDFCGDAISWARIKKAHD